MVENVAFLVIAIYKSTLKHHNLTAKTVWNQKKMKFLLHQQNIQLLYFYVETS